MLKTILLDNGNKMEKTELDFKPISLEYKNCVLEMKWFLFFFRKYFSFIKAFVTFETIKW